MRSALRNALIQRIEKGGFARPRERFMRTTSTETDEYLTAALESTMELT
jgi:hypothetical protein